MLVWTSGWFINTRQTFFKKEWTEKNAYTHNGKYRCHSSMLHIPQTNYHLLAAEQKSLNEKIEDFFTWKGELQVGRIERQK